MMREKERATNEERGERRGERNGERERVKKSGQTEKYIEGNTDRRTSVVTPDTRGCTTLSRGWVCGRWEIKLAS